MPELPEVEAARRAIEENCLGKKIKRSIVADDPKVVDGVSRSEFEASISGKTIVSARRKGKNLWLELDVPPFPTFQFGMAGAIYIKGVAVTKYKRSAVNDTDEWPSKYSKFFIEAIFIKYKLDDGLELSFTDKRRFAKVRLLKDPISVPPISELGPDALFEPMTVEEFTESLSKKKLVIKTLLLDQSFISGIGNWIADEVLYQARIHPLQIAANLSKEECQKLHKCIKEVIENALEVGADSSQFPNDWIFHSREKKPGKAFVDGKKIDFITAGGRTSAYVPELQKLRGSQGVKEASKSTRKTTKRKSDTNDTEDVDLEEPANNEGGELGNAKSREVVKGKGRGNKGSTKRKLKSNNEDDDDGQDSTRHDDDYEENDKVNTQVTKNATGKMANRKAKDESSQKQIQTGGKARTKKRKAK